MRPRGLSDLLASERGVFSIALVVMATALVFFGKLGAQAWVDFMKYLGGTLIASKTVTTAMETMKKAPDSLEESNGLTDLFASERGVFSIVLVVAASALAFVGKLETQAWVDFMKYLGGVLIASKTVTTAVETMKKKTPDVPIAIVVQDQGTGSKQ